MVLMKGRTYPIRGLIQSAGALWRPDIKAWELRDDQLGIAQFLAATRDGIRVYKDGKPVPLTDKNVQMDLF